MSSAQRYIRRSTPWGIAANMLHNYGMGTLFAANVLGAGSIYILSQTGASTGFALLWVLPLAFALDMIMHDMSARLARDGRPLMTYIRRVIGRRPAAVYGVSMSLVMQLWSVANYAVAGAVVAWFAGIGEFAVAAVFVAFIATVMVYTGTYTQVEAIISSLMVLVFGAYVLMMGAMNLPISDIGQGFVPGEVTDLTLIIAILGTTVYYPNFFIQSSMRPTKNWRSLKKYRKDNAVGIAFSVIVSAAILIVAAIGLSQGELTLTDPALPLIDIVGGWVLPVFMAAVLAASFTSATGTLFGSGFAVPQSLGHYVEFGDWEFKWVVIGLILISQVSMMVALTYTNLTPVRMAIIMPAINGAIFLPLTILAMYFGTKHLMGTKQKLITIMGVIVLFAGSLLTAESLYNTVVSFL